MDSSHNPHTRFAQWLESTGWCPLESAFRLGVDRSHINRIATKGRLPGRRLANTIERLSEGWRNGPVKSREWDDWKESSEERDAA